MNEKDSTRLEKCKKEGLCFISLKGVNSETLATELFNGVEVPIDIKYKTVKH
jgi:hypothetical protein